VPPILAQRILFKNCFDVYEDFKKAGAVNNCGETSINDTDSLVS
jgi:hypothetical protein